MVFGLLAGACSPARQVNPPPTAATAPAIQEARLRQAVSAWEGTPHRLGGNSRRGIDCSGLVVRIYDDLFGYRLPRTTAALAQTGQPAARSALRPGDLVFFRIAPGKSHVGIYLGQGEFAHASTRRGVSIARLDAPYWRSVFWTARRLLT